MIPRVFCLATGLVVMTLTEMEDQKKITGFYCQQLSCGSWVFGSGYRTGSFGLEMFVMSNR